MNLKNYLVFLLAFIAFELAKADTLATVPYALNGEWQLTKVFCGNDPNQKDIRFTPVPFSNFSPDIHLTYTVDTQSIRKNPAMGSYSHRVSLKALKSITTKSCPNSKLQSISGVFYSQSYNQEVFFNDSPNRKEGIIRGLNLGDSGPQTTSKPVSPAECDKVLGYFSNLENFLNFNHAEEELNRTYSFRIDGNIFQLGYYEKNSSADCSPNELTVLQFNRVKTKFGPLVDQNDK